MADLDGFPGSIYDAQGKPLEGAAAKLEQEQLDAYPHRSFVTDRDGATVFRVWLLADDADPAAISPTIMAEAVSLVLAGRGILIVAKRPEPEVDVRTGLLQALDLFTASLEAGGRA